MEERKKKRKFNIKLSKLRRERYVFTDKKHPEKGIMSIVLGAISVCTIACAIFFSYKNAGQAKPSYGAAVFLCVIYSLAGLVLGIMSRLERDIFKLFPNAGIILNSLSLIGMGILFYLAF